MQLTSACRAAVCHSVVAAKGIRAGGGGGVCTGALRNGAGVRKLASLPPAMPFGSCSACYPCLSLPRISAGLLHRRPCGSAARRLQLLWLLRPAGHGECALPGAAWLFHPLRCRCQARVSDVGAAMLRQRLWRLCGMPFLPTLGRCCGCDAERRQRFLSWQPPSIDFLARRSCAGPLSC